MSELHKETFIKRARHAHRCSLCHNKIEKGTPYKKLTGLCDGEFYETKICHKCEPVLTHYFHLYRDEDTYNESDVAEDVQETVKYDCPIYQNNGNSIKNCFPVKCISCDYGIAKYLEYEHNEYKKCNK